MLVPTRRYILIETGEFVEIRWRERHLKIFVIFVNNNIVYLPALKKFS